jgi:phage-related minor tail protein
MSRSDDSSQASADRPFAVPVSAIVVLVAAMAAAWIAAGSTGLLAHPLRHALTWVALCVAIVAGWPGRHPTNLPSVPGPRPLRAWLALAAAVVLGLIMTAPDQPAVNVLAVTLVTAALVRTESDLSGRAILIAALATAVLGVFRLAADSAPTVWLAADALGRALGWAAGQLTGQSTSWCGWPPCMPVG